MTIIINESTGGVAQAAVHIKKKKKKKEMLKGKCDPEDRNSGLLVHFFSIYICLIYNLGLFISLVLLLNKERVDEVFLFCFVFFYSYVHTMFGSFLPLSPRPLS
jgi:hypothetical protein